MDDAVEIEGVLTVRTDKKTATKFKAWVAIHEYGPYALRLVPTGVNTAVSIKHEKTGHEFDLTDYESI